MGNRDFGSCTRLLAAAATIGIGVHGQPVRGKTSPAGSDCDGRTGGVVELAHDAGSMRLVDAELFAFLGISTES